MIVAAPMAIIAAVTSETKNTRIGTILSADRQLQDQVLIAAINFFGPRTAYLSQPLRSTVKPEQCSGSNARL
jgi:hypothetical protein